MKRRRREKWARARNMGNALKAPRVRCGMTPEFVAGTVGVNRRAVLRWEKGGSILTTVFCLVATPASQEEMSEVTA